MKKLGLIILTLLIATAGWYALPPSSEEQAAHKISHQKPSGGNFTFDSIQGPVSLSDFKGKLTLIYFGYTFCPDICPTNLSNLAMAYQQLSDEQKAQLQILFISVDPERDTPDRLQEYANYFNSGIIGLTSDKATIDEVSQRYGVVYLIHKETPDQEHYSVDHSAFTYVVDQQGKLQTQLPHAATPDQFIEIITHYLSKSIAQQP